MTAIWLLVLRLAQIVGRMWGQAHEVGVRVRRKRAGDDHGS